MKMFLLLHNKDNFPIATFKKHKIKFLFRQRKFILYVEIKLIKFFKSSQFGTCKIICCNNNDGDNKNKNKNNDNNNNHNNKSNYKK